MRSTTLAAPLLLELQRAILERDAWPLLRVELPGEARGFYEHARDRHLDEFAAARRGGGAQASTRPRHPGARRHARAGRRSTRRGSRASPAAGAPCASADAEEALVLDAVADAGRRRSRPAWASARVRGVRATARCSSTARPGGGVGRAARVPGRARSSASREARELRIEAEGTDLALASKGRTWVNTDGQRNMPSGEVFTGPHEDIGERAHPLHASARRPPASRSAASSSTFRDGEVVRRTRRARARSTCCARSRPTTGARRLGEIGIGTNFGIDRPIGAILFDEKIGGTVHLALGRSYPETGGRNESRAALGPDLRPARGRAADRRRRGRAAGRALPRPARRRLTAAPAAAERPAHAPLPRGRRSPRPGRHDRVHARRTSASTRRSPSSRSPGASP